MTPLANPTVASLVELRGLPANHLARWPSIAGLADTVFVAANVFPIKGDSLLARPAYLGRLRQSSAGDLVALAPLELPPGEFHFAYPRVVAARGALHLVWAELGVRPLVSTAWSRSLPTSLWYAVLRNGSWSTPERLVTSQWLGWNDETGALSLTDAGVLHVAVWVGDSLPGVRHIRLAGGQQHATRLPYGGLNQASAIATRGDTVLIGLVYQSSATSRVMLVQSTDQGEHWGTPTIVSSREHGAVTGLALTETPDGRLLVIAEKPMGSFYLDTLRLGRVSDAGGALVTGVVTPPPQSAGVVLAAAPCDGTSVMLLSTFSLTPQIFDLRIPRNSLPTRGHPLLSEAEIAAFPGIGSTQRTAVAVFAYTRSRDVPARSVAMPLVSCTH